MINMMNDRILVRVEQHKTTTAGGLHLPDTSKPALVGTFRFAEVIAAGPGRVEVGYPDNVKPMSVKVGDRVCFHEGAGNLVQLKGELFMLLGNDNVEAVVPADMACSQVRFMKQSG